MELDPMPLAHARPGEGTNRQICDKTTEVEDKVAIIASIVGQFPGYMIWNDLRQQGRSIPRFTSKVSVQSSETDSGHKKPRWERMTASLTRPSRNGKELTFVL
jgi:hypothetical protein